MPPKTSKSSKPFRNLARKSTTSSSSATRKSKISRPPPKQLKTKPASAKPKPSHKRKQPHYTDKQLKLPSLNMITPAGITKPGGGKRKNKVFVDDEESMMTILAMVNAEKEGQIESKMMRMRRMEEIRQARLKEQEKKEEDKKETLEGVKKGLKKGRKGAGKENKTVDAEEGPREDVKKKSGKKRVAFA